jgi:MYXO-CTERM domain-containing protein
MGSCQLVMLEGFEPPTLGSIGSLHRQQRNPNFAHFSEGSRGFGAKASTIQAVKLIPVERRHSFCQFLFAAVVATLSFVLLPSSAFASGGLSSIILTSGLPGFVASSPGADNGPINATNVDTVFSGDTAAQLTLVSQQLANGDLVGYVRIWHSASVGGDGLVVTAFQTPTVYSISTFLGGFEKAAAEQVSNLNGSTFSVPGVPDASGYNTYVSSNDPPFREFTIGFAKGNTAFLIDLVSAKNDLTEADVIALAQRQWADAPGVSVAPQTPPSVAEDLLIGVIAALVVAMAGALWVRRRRRELVRNDPALGATGYESYKRLEKDQRKSARKALLKSRLNEEEHLNIAALAWASHNLNIYWVALASFVALSVTVAIVSQGHVVVVSLLAVVSLVSALNLQGKRKRFSALHAQATGAVPALLTDH